MKKILVCLFALLFCFSKLTSQEYSLVTIHGILGSPRNMHYLGSFFEKENKTYHYGYKSRDKKIMAHAEDLAFWLQVEASKHPGKPIYFLTHSMGGLILRAALNHPMCPSEAQIGKAVLLAPPNQGAAWGRLLNDFYLAHYIGKDEAALELMTMADFESLGQFPEDMQVLVIAGNFSLNPLIKEANDGTVAVSETYLSTPHKHIIIKQGHKSILLSKKAALISKNFLDNVEIISKAGLTAHP